MPVPDALIAASGTDGDHCTAQSHSSRNEHLHVNAVALRLQKTPDKSADIIVANRGYIRICMRPRQATTSSDSFGDSWLCLVTSATWNCGALRLLRLCHDFSSDTMCPPAFSRFEERYVSDSSRLQAEHDIGHPETWNATERHSRRWKMVCNGFEFIH